MVTIRAPVVHPGRFLKREMAARKLSANRLSLDIGVPSGRVTDILNGRRAITADTAGAARAVLRQQRTVLAGPAEPVRDRCGRTGKGRRACEPREASGCGVKYLVI